MARRRPEISEQRRAEMKVGLHRLDQQSGELVALRILRKSDLLLVNDAAEAGHPFARRLLLGPVNHFFPDFAGMNCLICPRELKTAVDTAAIVLLYGGRENTQDCLAMGLCRRCGARPDQKINCRSSRRFKRFSRISANWLMG